MPNIGFSDGVRHIFNWIAVGLGFKAGNYLKINNDGFLELIGTATVWEDDNVNLSQIKPGASAPVYVNYDGTTCMVTTFNASQTQEVVGGREIPHSFKTGGIIIPHIHWVPTTTAAGNVKWGLEYAFIGAGIILTGTAYAVTPANGIAWTNEIRTDFPMIQNPNIKFGVQTLFRLFRVPGDPQDTYPDSVAAFTYGIHYEKDSMGTRTVDRK